MAENDEEKEFTSTSESQERRKQFEHAVQLAQKILESKSHGERDQLSRELAEFCTKHNIGAIDSRFSEISRGTSDESHS